MGIERLRARVLLIIVLLISNFAHAMTGAEIAQLLNNRYSNTSIACAGDNPAFFCSGVLVRGVTAGHAGGFWTHSPGAITQGAESFTYLRADLGTREIGHKNGVVFTDQFTAISQGKPLDVLCAYPFIAGAESSRPDFGCGLPPRLLRQQTDPSSCNTLGIVDADGWLLHFQQQDSQPGSQCSLSTRDPAQFKASLVAHEGVDPAWSLKPNEVMIRNWDSQTPKLIPIEALFYDVMQIDALLGAQQDQRDYFNATGDWLPILRADLSHPEVGVFGFNLQDQLYIGYTTAQRLNERFSNTSRACEDGKAGFYCSGILIRGTAATTSFHAWNPSPGSQRNNGVSFSYIRADVRFNKAARAYGFIFKEFNAPTGHPPTLRCAYPYNASTSSSSDTCTFRGVCDQLGVTTVATWRQKFGTGVSPGCGLTASAEQFQLGIDVRTLNPAASGYWNEIMLAAWPQNIPREIPLEALYYEAGNLSSAQFIQRDYYTQTQRFLPIVIMNLAATDGQVFNYRPEDQISAGSVSRRHQLLESSP